MPKKPKYPSCKDSCGGLRGTKKSREASQSKRGQIVALTRLPSPKEIKELRGNLGLSATQFGKKFGLSRSTIKTFEGGSRKPNQRFTEQFWKFRDMTPRTSVRLIADFDLPPLVYVEAIPHPCRGHGNFYLWENKRRVYCKQNKGECRKLWLRQLRADQGQPQPRKSGKRNVKSKHALSRHAKHA